MELTEIDNARELAKARERVKIDLGKFWEDFDIDQIIETCYEFYNNEYLLCVPLWQYYDDVKLCAAPQPQITKPYDYRKAVRQDIRKVIYYDTIKSYQLEDFKTRKEAFSKILESLQEDGSVATGLYSAHHEAENYLAHNWSLLREALVNSGNVGVDILEEGAVWCDRLIRNYLMSKCLAEVLDEIEANQEVDWK